MGQAGGGCGERRAVGNSNSVLAEANSSTDSTRTMSRDFAVATTLLDKCVAIKRMKRR
jgi:hypothetical protein